MNKTQETLTKMVFQYIKETYPEDKVLNYLMKGLDELSEENKEPEKPTRPSYATPLSETLIEEKDRIKQIMDKVMDAHYKPGKFLYGDLNGGTIKKTEIPEPEPLVEEQPNEVVTTDNEE